MIVSSLILPSLKEPVHAGMLLVSVVGSLWQVAVVFVLHVLLGDCEFSQSICVKLKFAQWMRRTILHEECHSTSTF